MTVFTSCDIVKIFCHSDDDKFEKPYSIIFKLYSKFEKPYSVKVAALSTLFMLHSNSMGSIPLLIFPLCVDRRLLSIERLSILPELGFKPRQADSESMLTTVSLVGGMGGVRHKVYLQLVTF